MNSRQVGILISVLLLGPAIGLAQDSNPRTVVVPSVPSYLKTKVAAPAPFKARAPRTPDGVVPLGSQLSIRVDDKIKKPSKGERRFFEAEIVRDFVSNGTVLIPSGTRVRGRVAPSTNGSPELALTALELDGSWLSLQTETVSYQEPTGSKRGKWLKAARIGLLAAEVAGGVACRRPGISGGLDQAENALKAIDIFRPGPKNRQTFDFRLARSLRVAGER